MLRENVSYYEVVSILNRALEADPAAIQQLVHNRVICNKKIADDESIQVGRRRTGGYRVGILGVLNGLFGQKKDGSGVIAAKYDMETGEIVRFEVCEESDG